ncbi:Reverse transcriptase RNA-dependent DNA polymerase [Trinorchestia longiramus]|nr:Reverse transcriptase RNA-dependent DNA polymerase [Trinorchestia longiramus]
MIILEYGSGTKGYRLYDFNTKRILLSRDVVFNESQLMSFEKEPSKEIECVPCSFSQEEKHEDSVVKISGCNSTGYAKKFEVDYDETFSPVVRFESVRAVLALAVLALDLAATVVEWSAARVLYRVSACAERLLRVRNPAMNTSCFSFHAVSSHLSMQIGLVTEVIESRPRVTVLLSVTQRSVKQSCVALSTAEAEYVAQAGAAQKANWLKHLLDDLEFKTGGPMVVNEANQSAICLVQNPKYHGRNKHIDIKFHYVRDLV